MPRPLRDPFGDLVRRRRRQRMARTLLVGCGGAGFVVAMLAATGAPSVVLAVAALLATVGTGIGAARSARRDPDDERRLALHVDRALPEAQESTTLLLRPPEPPPALEQLQRQRVLAALQASAPETMLPARRLLGAGAIALGGLLSAALVLGFDVSIAKPLARPGADATAAAAAPSAPRIEGVTILVAPPAYRGLPARRVRLDPTAGNDVVVEENAALSFEVVTGSGSSAAQLLLPHESLDLALDPSVPLGATRTFQRRLVAASTTVFSLRVVFDDPPGGEVRTAYSRLTVMPDGAPTVRVIEPAAARDRAIERPPDAPGSVEFAVEASDAEGLGGVELVMTLSSGAGEGVRFRESRLVLREESRTPTRARLRRAIDLAPLGLEPGSEVYLYAEARDRREPHANLTRSEAVRVRITGGAGASSAFARGIVVRPPEEYFRSQRQIILDTEKLLRDERRISRAEFELRAQALGLDQQALRLRYGTLLGEEFESGAPVEAGDSGGGPEQPEDGPDSNSDPHPHAGEPAPPDSTGSRGSDAAPGSLLAVLPSGFVHLHDSAESANYFPDPLRRQLKEVLAAMWDAEGRLRVFAPRAALPHEYQALRLLKDLQQQSRAYVPKFASALPPVLLDRRLVGDLSRIVASDRIEPAPMARVDAAFDAWRRFLTWREARDTAAAGADAPAGAPLASSSTVIASVADLETVADALALAAASGRLASLESLDAVRELIAAESRADRSPGAGSAGALPGAGDSLDREAIERALWSALDEASRVVGPAGRQALPGGESLGDLYRRALLTRPEEPPR